MKDRDTSWKKALAKSPNFPWVAVKHLEFKDSSLISDKADKARFGQ